MKKLVTSITLMYALILGVHVDAFSQNAPTVDGLFYGTYENRSDIENLGNSLGFDWPASKPTPDSERYLLYSEAVDSESKLYYYVSNGTLYVALVVDRRVNDNVFDTGSGSYMSSAGWTSGGNLTATRRIDSEYAEFTLEVGDESWTWKQGYAGQTDEASSGGPSTRFDRRNATWISGVDVSGGVGDETPPSYRAASSFAWNMNNYALTGADWMPGSDTNANEWKSPFRSNNSDDVSFVDGHPGVPSNGQPTFSHDFGWEWSMVYEWSVDLNAISDGQQSPIFILSGSSHHSPKKEGEGEDDPFPDCEEDPNIECLVFKDFGDLPTPYATLREDDGARHIITTNNAFLGESVDADVDGQPDFQALGDLGDEDGVFFNTPFVPGETAEVEVIAGTPGYLSAFIDFDSNSGNNLLSNAEIVDVVSSPGGASVSTGPIADTHLSQAGTYVFKIEVPEDATNVMYSRWRFTNNAGEGGNSTSGQAASGEVEDYVLAAIKGVVWQDNNEDGINDSGEPPVADVEVNLFQENGSSSKAMASASTADYSPVLDAEGNPVGTITNEDGEYELPGVPPGDYVVQFIAPLGFTVEGLDSDVDQLTGFTQQITLEPADIEELDAGLILEETTSIEMEGACYRMLSSPVQGSSYTDLLVNVWTQGEGVQADGKEYHVSAGTPNVWLYDNDEDWTSSADGDGSQLWQAPSNLNSAIPAGSGFLLSMFEAFEVLETGAVETGPFGIEVTGDENPAPVHAPVNTNNGGWTLAGNPFFTSIDFNEVHNASSNINGVVYIWDRAFEDDENSPAPGLGNWRTYTVGEDGLGVGEIPGGIIHAYQGFFVQSAESGTPELTIPGSAKAPGGEFYGKERSQNNKMRLKMSGDRGTATTWLVFSDKGSFDRLSYDAYELEPMASDYMMLASRKADGTLLDIGHYPTPGESFEVPVAIESTIPGTYTITATDFELMMDQDLYFVDRETNTTMPIDESFSYEFTISNGAAKIQSPDVNRCSMGVTQMSKNAGNDRFVITTKASANVDNDLPQDVSLKQNYPNPFNPTTSIQYSLPESANVSLEVYNMLGQRVASIAEGQQSAGSHTVDFDASHLTSGVYIYRLTAGSTVINKRMTLVK